MAQVSIFNALRQHMGDKLPVVSLTKATLVHLSHTLEDFVLKNHLPALIFTGFQESTYWRKETRRYRALAEQALQVCIFAGKPLPEDESVGAIQITLTGDDPLRQEWFLAIMSESFHVILCGLDNMRPADQEAHRTFDTVWSFDVETVSKVLDVLEGVVQQYRPDVLDSLVQARKSFPPVDPDPNVIVMFTKELLNFEDTLQYNLYQRTKDLTLRDALYRSLVVNSPIALLMLDNKGRVLLSTGSREPEVFLNGHPLVGDSIFDSIRHIPEMTQAIQRLLQKEVSSLSLTMQLSDITAFEFRASAIEDGDLAGDIICVLVDISDRVREQQARMESERLDYQLTKERELNEIRKQLMITLSHELRTPLSIIQTGSDLLNRYFDKLTPGKRESRLQTMHEQIQQLTRILGDIDMVVQSDNDTLIIERAHEDIITIIQSVIDEFQRVYPHNIQFTDGDEVDIAYIDARWFRYVIRNLLSNAAKYSSGEKPIIVQVQVVQGWLHLTVKDQGIGIPEPDRQRLFEPFFRASNVQTVDGTGLGLVIINNIVQAHGGNIRIESEENLGTTVTVELPLG